MSGHHYRDSLLSTLSSPSSDSLELSVTENNKENINETFDSSYSLLFDKAKHNFTTSSEISFINHQSPLVDQNQTVTKERSITVQNGSIEEPITFNPWLLLFIQDDDDDQQQTNKIEPIEISSTLIHPVSIQQGRSDMKTFDRQQQEHQSRR